MKAGQDVLEGRGPDLVGLYLDEIGRFPLLTKDDEQRLGRAIVEGRKARSELAAGKKLSAKRKRDLSSVAGQGDAATEEFVNCNLRLVISIAKRYRWSGIPLLDLVQEGNIGLAHAVEKFDWRLGFKFSTYATWWIRQAIGRAIENTSRTVRLPAHVGDEVKLIRKLQREIEEETGRQPSLNELAEIVNMSVDHVTMLLRADAEPASLDAGIGEDGTASLFDVVADVSAGDGFSAVDASDQVARLVSVLQDLELQVVSLRYGLDGGGPRTLVEVGRLLGCSNENVRQILRRAEAKMHRAAMAHNAGVEAVAV